MVDRTKSKGAYQKTKGTVGRRERMKAARHDPYEEKKKWPDGTRCSSCGAYVVNGRWTWEHAAVLTGETLCPACRRIADRFPAGVLEIRGSFAAAHASAIMKLLRNVQATEEQEHPLERIMAVRQDGDKILVETTGIHLACRMGKSLTSAFKGDLSLQYGEDDEHVRVRWQR